MKNPDSPDTTPEVLKPCPFCRDDLLDVDVLVPSENPPSFRVFCNTCDCLGPHGGTKEKAIKLWNQR
jgi:hypothetical protein